jgi:hypothetical protein
MFSLGKHGRLPSLTSSADAVRDDLPHFLVSWLFSNNRKAVALVAAALKPILSAINDLAIGAPLIESLLAPDVPEVTSTVLATLPVDG